MARNRQFRITRLRLVNFHNLGTVTLDIRDGGHLFLLGDNGSGKTTVLDAIHFVLVPDRAIEFNSAARVVGAKNSGGRNVQGIVMRYNIEADGPMNADGGITYAALEVADDAGRAVSLCVGLSARSMEEQYESWAAIADMPVADLPVIHEDGGRFRPTTRAEFKEGLDGRGAYFPKTGKYREALAERFFESPETYKDVCKLLATGKAYREIAARAGDYDKLFRELLQEPSSEVFDRLIRDLRSLDESRQKLDDIRRSVEYVRGISSWRDKIDAIRVDESSALWIKAEVERRRCLERRDAFAESLSAAKLRSAELDNETQRLKEALDRSQLRLEELRRQDPDNLSSREKELRNELEAAERKFRAAKNSLVLRQAEKKSAEGDLEKENEAMVRRLGVFSTEILKAGRGMLFSVNEIVSAYDDATRDEFPERAVGMISIRPVVEKANAERDNLVSAITSLEGGLKAEEDKLSLAETELARLKAQKESTPRIECFDDADAAVEESMLDAYPLYRRLEPMPGLKERDIAILEQVIGDDVLGTWIVSEKDADALRKLLFGDFPAQSIAVATEDEPEFPCSWLKKYFDFDKSAPDALVALANQLASKSGPHTEKFLDDTIMCFRRRERPSRYSRPRLIGTEARVAELRRKTREQEEACASLKKAIREIGSKIDDAKAAKAAVCHLESLLQQAQDELAGLARRVSTARSTCAQAERFWEEARDAMAACEEDRTRAADRHGDILLQMNGRGIGADLQERIAKAEREKRRLESDWEDCTKECGQLEARIQDLTSSLAEAEKKIAASREERERCAEDLLKIANVEGDICEFVYGRMGNAGKAEEKIDEWLAEIGKEGATLAERIGNALRSGEGVQDGFVFDRESNAIIDRRGKPIAEVLEYKTRQLADQESIINEDTRRLFQTFVMEDLMRSMQESVLRLGDMERKMKGLLGRRMFGHNRYAFAVSPVAGYERIVSIVKGYNALGGDEIREDMKNFIDEHLDTIVATEVGDVPAVMDYRNWFRYDLKIVTENDEGKVIDRRIKSMGSGGEQAVPNYLLILTIADFLYSRDGMKLPVLLFDEAFYGIDAGRRDQILAFATEIGLQLFVASPDQDGVKKEIPLSTTVFVVKDSNFDVHLYPYYWNTRPRQLDMLSGDEPSSPLSGGNEL